MDQIAQFQEQGFALFPSFYSIDEIDVVNRAISAVKASRPQRITVDLLDTPGGSTRALLASLDDDEIENRHYKINDLYLDLPEVRELALSARVSNKISGLLGHAPVLCNSLYMDRGTTQPPHVDSIYMTPQTPNHLIAIWVALEDAHADAGQLEYFPGSHLLPQMVFSNNSFHSVPDEMEDWKAFMYKQVADARLEKKAFSAKKGDVFVWHANLLHAGGSINDWKRTRKSLVFHYYSQHDCERMEWKKSKLNAGYWLEKDHPVVAGEYDEQAYLDRYPDVAQAVASGAFPDGRAHYELHGKKEGRIPSRA